MDLELAAATDLTQEVEVSIHQSFVEEPAIMTCWAPTMDIVSTVPLGGVLISGAHASPLVVTANQTTAPLLVAGPSFPPVTQGPISMLKGAPISLMGAPGMQPAPYRDKRARGRIRTRALSLNAVGDAGVRAAGSSQEVAGSSHSHTWNRHP